MNEKGKGERGGSRVCVGVGASACVGVGMGTQVGVSSNLLCGDE